MFSFKCSKTTSFCTFISVTLVSKVKQTRYEVKTFNIMGKFLHVHYMSRIVRKPDFCLGENKGADQLRGNREADQRLCFRYTDSTISLLLKSEIAKLLALF